MAKIKAKRGPEANLGNITLDDGEFAVTTDTKKLYVGVAGVKICLGGASSLGDMLKSIYDTDNDGIVDNADKLDGKHASDFAPAGFGLGGNGKRLATSTDLNTIIANGWYDVQNPVNGPYSTGWFNFIVMCSGDANYLTQLGFGMTVNIGHTYIRTRNAGNWSAWTELYSTSVKPSLSDIGASSSTHNHDSSYMKIGPVIWNDLKGV